MDGWFEHHGFVCHGCSARQGRQVVYGRVIDTRPPAKLAEGLPPFQLGVTTTPPDDAPDPARARPDRAPDTTVG